MKALAAVAVVAAFAVPDASAHLVPASRHVEHGARVLVWLDAHPTAGTPSSRAAVRRAHLWLVWDGLERAGVLSGLGCIHRYEGSWRDAGDPYWGGLQMDRSFMRSYGRDFLRVYGLANRWPIWAQYVAAYRAHRSGRGYGPWPNTARYCGLL